MIVAVGDSITNGYGRDVGSLVLRPWPAWLAIAYRTTCENLAEDAASVDQIQERQLPRLPDAADIAVGLLGANDVNARNFEEQYLGGGAAAVVAALTACGDVAVVATLPHQTRVYSRDASMPARVRRSNEHLRELAAEHGAVLVDLAHTFDGREWMLGHDRLHWNAAGHLVAAKATVDALGAAGHPPAQALPDPPGRRWQDWAVDRGGWLRAVARGR